MKRLAAGLMLTAILTATPAHAADRVDRITAALRQSPVFVDPDVSYLLDARDRTALSKQIAAAGVPIYLVAVPLLSDDESAGSGDYLAYLLHRRLGRNGIYMIADQRGSLEWDSYQVPRDDELDYALMASDKPLPKKLHDVIDAFAHSPAGKPSNPLTPRPPVSPAGQKDGVTGRFVSAFFPSLLASGLVLTVLWFVYRCVRALLLAVRSRRPATLGPRRLRRTARAELVRLARAIGSAAGDNPGFTRAMADYDAAKLLHDEKTDPGSVFGVVVLALDGQDALRHETADPPARCMANPLHGTAERSVRTVLAGLAQAKRPLCAVCVRDGHRRPLTLEIDGQRRPYYQAPGLWEKIRGRPRDLPERVLEYLGVE
ncbi:hypothetical protein [Actinomadura sp. DC4]|uniref:hypothetical protein n=1 Tax=Actinomadura sp. DC4 TaxID=3055069 RepID=UPI0025B0A955|nr:hypothetical protein [Actinomadura sp. DC4]MDN3357082.1 hypothetical protein [Actinomadura sp. DC4]